MPNRSGAAETAELPASGTDVSRHPGSVSKRNHLDGLPLRLINNMTRILTILRFLDVRHYVFYTSLIVNFVAANNKLAHTPQSRLGCDEATPARPIAN